MSALSVQAETPFVAGDWQPDIVQLLDEQHLVACASDPRRRMHFAVSLGQFLQSLRDAEVCALYGRFITDLESFCYQLERAIPGPVLERRIDGPRGVTALLRSRDSFRGRSSSKFRFYVWHDADVLLKADEELFANLVETILGVAGEAEYASDDMLLIHRAVFVGGPMLSRYADRAEGQLQSWGQDPFGDPFWRIVSGLERPPVGQYSIDTLCAREQPVGA